MIWAACLPSAHSSAPACQPASACAAAPEDASSPDAEDRGLQNQSDTAESAACAGSREADAAGAGIIGVVAGDDADNADQPFPVWLLPVWLLPVWLLPVWLLPVWLLPVWLVPVWLV